MPSSHKNFAVLPLSNTEVTKRRGDGPNEFAYQSATLSLGVYLSAMTANIYVLHFWIAIKLSFRLLF